MNLAQLLGELESAVDEAKEAGERVRKAIEELKSIFGSIGIEAGRSVTVIEPTMDLPDVREIKCPYCGKEFPEWKRPHRDSPHFGPHYSLVRHIAQVRRYEATRDPPVKTHGTVGTSTGFH